MWFGLEIGAKRRILVVRNRLSKASRERATFSRRKGLLYVAQQKPGHIFRGTFSEILLFLTAYPTGRIIVFVEIWTGNFCQKVMYFVGEIQIVILLKSHTYLV